jgi:hypothetical protein
LATAANVFFRRIVGSLLVVLSSITPYNHVETSYQNGRDRVVQERAHAEGLSTSLMPTTYTDPTSEAIFVVRGLIVAATPWPIWALIVAFLVRRQLPLSFGRFVLRLVGIDQ